MASVTFPTELGGNGQTYTDNADPETGLDGLGYTVRFIPCLKQAVAMGLSAQSNASAAASYLQQCQTLRQEVAADRQAVAADRAHVDQQKGLVDTATEEAQQSAANVDADNIVHKPGSGLPNAAGEAYRREVVGGDGPLMVRGFNGFGGQTTDATNIDELQGTQLRRQRGDDPNAFLGTSGHVLHWERVAGGVAAQLIATDGGELGLRIRSSGGSWAPSHRFFSDRNILGAVSQFGGIPNGGLIERGSNSFGRYVALADGTLSCTKQFLEIDYINGSTLRGRWTFPKPFSNSGRIVHVTLTRSPSGVAPPSSYRGASWEDNQNASTSYADVGFLGNNEFADEGPAYVSVSAEGSWFEQV
ncbi:hypothetical protein LZG37_19435 [Halomonas titanicae]|uniref:hypothetical protein n=1 Tax=Vreelandella titanicae TaxID=664683 RepID=UPI001F3F923B|nr:hypothetical protein [Halomonas titanicae]MCE7520315.1 hypothetical protein [Halomonas titanicae]